MEHFLINNKVPPPERLLKQLDRPHSYKETNGTEERLHENLYERQRTGLLKALKLRLLLCRTASTRSRSSETGWIDGNRSRRVLENINTNNGSCDTPGINKSPYW